MEEYIMGTCTQMCPDDEIIRREKEKLIHVIETKISVDSNNKKGKADKNTMVKEFSRSAAGRGTKSSDIRPPPVLKTTITYLINEVLTRRDVVWNVVYDFIFDRIRAIRQDLVIQNCYTVEYAFILEVAVRFYIYSGYRLCEEPMAVFDPHLNNYHLQECLKQLLRYYFENQEASNYAEIVSFYIIHNLKSFEALSYTICLPTKLRTQNEFSNAFALVEHWNENNFVRFIRLLQRMSFLQLCLLHTHLPLLQRRALYTMTAAHKAFPLNHLSKLLFFNDTDETKTICEYYGIAVEKENIKFLKGSFIAEKNVLPRRFEFINRKLHNAKIEDVMLGIKNR